MEKQKKIHVKRLFWDGRCHYSTDEVDVDLSNGRSIRIKPNMTVEKVMAALEEATRE